MGLIFATRCGGLCPHIYVKYCIHLHSICYCVFAYSYPICLLYLSIYYILYIYIIYIIYIYIIYIYILYIIRLHRWVVGQDLECLPNLDESPILAIHPTPKLSMHVMFTPTITQK